ncbi:sulfurtransferase TusA family protein [Streptomyces sp. NPDC051020]|uniref:sulfurtransferase TusA family protein n=1 Tax=Streptomyces sp. NPDC051020 TaxID=3155409 RepID=UPI0034399933
MRDAALLVDGTGLLCVTLLLRLHKEIDGAAAGTVAHIVATDPAAPLDLPAWCHMTGHHHLGPAPGHGWGPVRPSPRRPADADPARRTLAPGRIRRAPCPSRARTQGSSAPGSISR